MYKNMDEEEKLIRLVKQHPCLYNVQAKDYVDKNSKHRAWAQISQEMNISTSECSKKWKILRDCFRKAVRARERMRLAGRTTKRPIKFEKDLRFLIPYLVDKKSNQIIPDEDSTLDSDEKISRLYRHYTEAKKLENPMDSFFLTMSRKVKKMPKKIQAEIERDVFRIVNDAEMKLAYAHEESCSPSYFEATVDMSDITHEIQIKEEIMGD